MLTLSRGKLLCTRLILMALLTNSTAALAEPVAQSVNGIQYMSGGIGIDEIDAMHSAVKEYNLIMQFQVKGTGAFISDVDVSILNKSGKEIFSTKSEGPCLFVNLPTGTYKVKADFNGKTLTKPGVVRKNHRTELYFYWPLVEKNDVVDRDAEKSNEPRRHPDCT